MTDDVPADEPSSTLFIDAAAAGEPCDAIFGFYEMPMGLYVAFVSKSSECVHLRFEGVRKVEQLRLVKIPRRFPNAIAGGREEARPRGLARTNLPLCAPRAANIYKQFSAVSAVSRFQFATDETARGFKSRIKVAAAVAVASI